MKYKPSGFHVFVVLDPKLREIFAPSFRDRLAQQWLISLIEPTIDKQFIDEPVENYTKALNSPIMSEIQESGPVLIKKMNKDTKK